MQIPIFCLDVFTDSRFRGNPAAVCPLNSWLDDGQMRKVAAEINLSATAFLVVEDRRRVLRWFTPRCEIRLCGHGTLAAGYVALNLLEGSDSEVKFETRFGGTLAVRKEAGRYAMDFPALIPKHLDPAPDLRQALGLNENPAEVLEVNDTYFAVFEREDSIEEIRPNFELLEKLHPYAVSVTAPSKKVDFVSRYFAPSYGVPEDPVTGSAHCALASYWAGRLGKTRLEARQLSERGGELSCEIAGDRVVIRGAVVLTRQATLTI